MDYKLIRPCSNCPFRSDLPEHNRGWLSRRISSIVEDVIYGDNTFMCHKTLSGTHSEDSDSTEYYPSGTEQQCAGALIMAQHEGVLFNNQAHRLATRLGMFNPDNLNMDAPVFKSVLECLEFHKAE